MIGMLKGQVLMVSASEVILDVGGVGYILQCGARTLGELSVGAQALLHVETHVRETAITLYGFADEEERAWFVRLQSVQKVGPKAALAILDTLSPAEILSAASLEDKTAFSRASGVGPSLAGRIIMELSGKAPPAGRGFGTLPGLSEGAAKSGASTPPSVSSHHKDAVSALVNLGIDQGQALRAVASAAKTAGETYAINDLVKLALKELSQ